MIAFAIGLAFALIVVVGPAIWTDVLVSWRAHREMQKPETRRLIDRRVQWRMKQRSTKELIDREVERRMREQGRK